MGDEIDAGEGIGISLHRAGVDAFARPQIAQHGAVDVVAEARVVSDLGALACRGDGEVGGVATKTLKILARAGAAGLVELDHRLAHREYVEPGLCVHCEAAQNFGRPPARADADLALAEVVALQEADERLRRLGDSAVDDVLAIFEFAERTQPPSCAIANGKRVRQSETMKPRVVTRRPTKNPGVRGPNSVSDALYCEIEPQVATRAQKLRLANTASVTGPPTLSK